MRTPSLPREGLTRCQELPVTTATAFSRLFWRHRQLGGDFRAREANVYRLAQVSVNIIDQCVAQGALPAREYGGLLDTRSFGGVQVQRTFYARGQTGQQLLLGTYQALEEQLAAGTANAHTRREALDVVIVNAGVRAHRDAESGNRSNRMSWLPLTWLCWHRVATSDAFYLSTNAKGFQLYSPFGEPTAAAHCSGTCASRRFIPYVSH